MNGPYSKVQRLKNMSMFFKIAALWFSRNEDPAGQQLSSLSTLIAGEFYQAGQDASGQQQ